MNMQIRKYYIATVIAVLLWSASFIATKIAYGMMAPMMVAFVRFLSASVLLGLIRRAVHDDERPDRTTKRQIAVSGLLGITLYFAAENLGVRFTSASNASLIVASYPAVTALLEFLIFHVRPDGRKILGILLAFGGVAVLTAVPGEAAGSQALFGNAILLVAGVVWAFYNFYTGRLVGKCGSMTLSYYQMLYGCIFFIPFVLVEHSFAIWLTAPGIAAMVYLSCGCSVAAYILYNYGLKELSAAASVSIMNLVPVFGLIFSALILHEQITLRQILGGIIVLVGVSLSTRAEEKGQSNKEK